MIKNYFKVAFRNLFRNKSFSILNIAGLAIGMASAILILLWIQNEVSYDRFHKNTPHLYEAWNRGIANGKLECWEFTPTILGTTLKLEYPEVKDIARAYNQWFVTSAGEKKMSSNALLADAAFLRMFSFPLLHGDAATALNNVYGMVVTEKMAIKMFGTTDAIGKIIKIDKDNFTVEAVLKNLPTNTQFDFEYILPWAYAEKLGNNQVNWSNNATQTYVQLNPGSNEGAFNTAIKDITKKHSNGIEKQEVFLYPISKLHLYSNFENGKPIGGRINVVITFGIIAAFILLIACINFMNLSTARSEKRAKEVGIRKVAGALRGSLIAQFLGESILIAFISAALAILLVQLSLPFFASLVNKQLTLPYTSIYFWLYAMLFVLITGVLAGSYPAFFLSAFRPVSVLKGSFKKSNATVNPRKILVVLQFSFSILLIISTIVITQQMRYAQEREAGYARGQLVYHYLTGELAPKYDLVKKELLRSGAAVSITKTLSPLTAIWSDSWGLEWAGKAAGDKTIFDIFSADEGLSKTAGISIVAGRDFDPINFPTDSSGILLNEAAVKAMGFKDPIGQIVRSDDKPWHVVGVIKNIVIRSPYAPMYPMVIYGGKSSFNVMNIKMNPAHTTAANMKTIEKIFRAYNPEYPFEYHFPDDDYALKFEDNKRIAKLVGIFAFLTIMISCLGLFGLAAYMAENRIKEIGVRKVLGASVSNIVALLSKEFLQLVAVAFVIASPLGWFAMHKWLNDFSYRINIGWWIFAITGAIAILISLFTVSFQAIKAALANPVKSLRSE